MYSPAPPLNPEQNQKTRFRQTRILKSIFSDIGLLKIIDSVQNTDYNNVNEFQDVIASLTEISRNMEEITTIEEEEDKKEEETAGIQTIAINYGKLGVVMVLRQETSWYIQLLVVCVVLFHIPSH